MSNAVDIVVTLRDGTRKTMSMPAGHGDGSVDMTTLLSSLTKLRDQSNDFLTEIVNQEKATAADQTNNTGGKSADEDEDEEDDGDDDDDDDETGQNGNSSPSEGQPPSKRPKT